MHREPERDKLL